jgi:WhiB family transcriptional regulator, redox-sensing transcriptional regulator
MTAPSGDAAYQAALLATAKSVAIPIAACVASSLPPAHLMGTMTRDQLAALVIVLAEAADHRRLRAIAGARDSDGRPDLTRDFLRLRRAHAEYTRLTVAGQPIPPRIRELEREYQRQAKARLRQGRQQQDHRGPGRTKGSDMTMTQAGPVLLPSPPARREGPACAGMDPELFFPVSATDPVAEALAACAACPVRPGCLEYARANPRLTRYGIWGGMTEEERVSGRRRERRRAGRRDGLAEAS